MNIIYYIYSIIFRKNEFVNDLTNLLTLLLVFTGLILLSLKLDKEISIGNWIPLSLVIFGYLIFISDKIFQFFESQNSEEYDLNEKEFINEDK